MSDLLDDQYLDWLSAVVGRQAENINHNRLLYKLYCQEFIPMTQAPSDENRCKDGEALRREFLQADRDSNVPRHWLEEGCSVLEMLIGIARHLAFEMDGEVSEWFWHLIDNLGLTRWHDGRWSNRVVEGTIERLVWRQYSFDGTGGLFPLREPHEDQRNVELWFQMEAYMLEMS